MKVGDLVQMKGTRVWRKIGVVIETTQNPQEFKVHWTDGRVLWERDKWIKAVKKCP